MKNAPGLEAVITQIVRKDRGRLLAALIGSLNSFELAEEAFSDALESAIIHWQRGGVPDNPQGWLLRVARRKAIDRIRRQVRFRERQPELARLAAEDEMDANSMAPDIPDKRLALIFTCCHPALDAKSRVALTLRSLGGLSTQEIARAYLDKETTMGQRLSRAKTKIAVAKIPYAVPGPELWGERLGSVLSVIYLIFNEGYSASSGDAAIRGDLCEEAIYLARLLDQLRGDEPEIIGLLSLMLTTHARRAGRQSDAGTTIGLADQDRGLWDGAMVQEGLSLLERAMALGQAGPFQIKAAISALHASVKVATRTDWPQIALLYGRLYYFEPTAVVQLNRAVSLAEAGDVGAALAEFDRLAPELQGYQPLHAARAEYLARQGDMVAAIAAYDRAIELTGNGADREFLTARRAKLMH
ncbi:MAG: RNA polymerase sigma factor [Paracoccaceae bacterium]